MPLKPKNPDAPAKGMRWVYRHVDLPEPHNEQSHLHYDQLKANVRKLRKLNNLPIGSNFDNDFDHNVCENTPGENCYDDTTPPLAKRAVKFAKAVTAWAQSGFKTRSKEEVERAMAICEGCEHFTGETSAFKIACRKCGCSSKKLYMETEHCPVNKW